MSAESLMRQTATHYAKTSYDGYGNQVLSSGSDIECRFQPKTKRKLLDNGDVVTIVATCYVPKSTTISSGDKVTYSGANYQVLDVYPTPNGEGQTEFIRVDLVKWQI